MAVTHEWGVNPELRTKSQDGHDHVVFKVSWYLRSSETVGTGDDAKTYEASCWGDAVLDTSDLSTFTPFADLTESEVLGWAKDTIDANAAEGEGVTCAEWEASMARNIAKQINPPTAVETAPWAS